MKDDQKQYKNSTLEIMASLSSRNTLDLLTQTSLNYFRVPVDDPMKRQKMNKILAKATKKDLKILRIKMKKKKRSKAKENEKKKKYE